MEHCRRVRIEFRNKFTVKPTYFINDTVNDAATSIAIKSAIGAANNIPSIPMNIGKIRINGIKQTISRIIEEITACAGFPTAWKKMDVIFMIQVKVTRERKIRKVFSANTQ